MFFALYGNNGLCLQIFTARKRGPGQGNVFTPVCYSVHGGGEGLASQHALGKGVGFPAGNGKGGGLASQHALGKGVGFPAGNGKGGAWLPSMHWNWEKRAICILLECFLVENEFLDYHLSHKKHPRMIFTSKTELKNLNIPVIFKLPQICN